MRAVLALLMVSLSVGCAHTTAVSPKTFGNSITVSMSPEAAFVRTMLALAQQKPVVRRADFTHVVITIPPTPARLTEAQADCGTNAGTPYLTDTRTTTDVAYSVRLQGAGDRTSITVNAKITGRFEGTSPQPTTTDLSCVSRGALERALIAKIQQEFPAGIIPRIMETAPD